MKLDFDLASVKVVEFGVGRDDGPEQVFVAVPVDKGVQEALREMAEATWGAMHGNQEGPAKYEPSDKHGATEYLTLPLDDDMASFLRMLHEATNLGLSSRALDNPAGVFCYFVRLTDQDGRRLTALRRATHFKGVLKKRLIRVLSDSLEMIGDRVFRLDTDFDLLVDSANVHIWRPSGFEFTGKLQQAILEAVPQNIRHIAADLPYVSFNSIEEYAARRPRAARYLASIRGRQATKRVDKALLIERCRETGVELTEDNGTVSVAPGHELRFLEVLDRRLYEVRLVRGSPERYRAASRTKLNG